MRPRPEEDGTQEREATFLKYLHQASARRALLGRSLQLARRGLVRSISEDCELELAIVHIERTGVVRLQVVLEVGQFQRGQERSFDMAVHAMGDARKIPRFLRRPDAGSEHKKHLRDLERSEPEKLRRLRRTAG